MLYVLIKEYIGSLEDARYIARQGYRMMEHGYLLMRQKDDYGWYSPSIKDFIKFEEWATAMFRLREGVADAVN